jgi:hypothetical protein
MLVRSTIDRILFSAYLAPQAMMSFAVLQGYNAEQQFRHDPVPEINNTGNIQANKEAQYS